MATQSGSQMMDLFAEYYKNPTLQLRNQLVQLNVGLVRKIAHRVSYQCTEPYEDLEQLGYLGLIRAVERFNPHQGCAFSSFAVPYIRGEMLHFLRDKSSLMKLPRRWQELHQEGQKVRKQLQETLGRSPKESEIAAQLNVSVEEWHQTQNAFYNSRPVSLDAVVHQQSDYQTTLAETLPDQNYQVWQQQAEDWQQLAGALDQLEPKTRAAIKLVCLQDLPRKEAAQQIGVSPMTVSRRLQRGIEQLVGILQPAAAHYLAS